MTKTVKKTTKKKVSKDKSEKPTTNKKKFDSAAFYKKYPWVVKNSVKEVSAGSVVDGVKAAHGRICKIKCQETGKTRTINVQDAFQTKFTKEVQKRKQLERAAERRKKKVKSKKAK